MNWRVVKRNMPYISSTGQRISAAARSCVEHERGRHHHRGRER